MQMNWNEILIQQQAALTAALQSYQRLSLDIQIVGLALSMLFCWIVYVFYGRLREIGDELRKFRIAYELTQDWAAKARSRPSAASANPIESTSSADMGEKYMPK